MHWSCRAPHSQSMELFPLASHVQTATDHSQNQNTCHYHMSFVSFHYGNSHRKWINSERVRWIDSVLAEFAVMSVEYWWYERSGADSKFIGWHALYWTQWYHVCNNIKDGGHFFGSDDKNLTKHTTGNVMWRLNATRIADRDHLHQRRFLYRIGGWHSLPLAKRYDNIEITYPCYLPYVWEWNIFNPALSNHFLEEQNLFVQDRW